MPLYDRSCREILAEWLRKRLKPGGTISRAEIREHMLKHYPKFTRGTINAHIIQLTTNVPSRRHYNLKPGRDDVLYRDDKQRLRLYEPDRDPPPVHGLAGEGVAKPTEVVETGEEEVAEEFPELRYEQDLRDFLARNPEQIEPGLRLYRAGGQSGTEFAVDEGRIDLLAVDKDRRLVVIELKAGTGRPQALGQLLYYMGWVEQNLAKDQSVRGLIIAREISEKLRIAASKLPDVGLYTYQLQVKLTHVGGKR